MKIIEALKDLSLDIRLSNGKKWMVWSDSTKEWVVYELKYRKSVADEVIRSDDEALAVNWLLAD